MSGPEYTLRYEVVHKMQYLRASICVQENSGILQPVWTLCFKKIERCAAGGKKKEQSSENVNILLNMLSTHGVEMLADLVKAGLHNHGYAQSLKSGLLYVSRSEFV